MTEDEAGEWIVSRFGHDSRERVARFLALVVEESRVQNLIAPNSVSQIWSRHALDSAQLLPLAPPDWQTWLDIGTGAGFPGMIVALLARDRSVTMIEPRRRRAEFLQRCIDCCMLDKAAVIAARVEQVTIKADVISARAVSSTENLLRAAGQCAKTNTVWLLPRGQSGADDVASLKDVKGPMFHVEHSLTDPSSLILVGSGYA